MIVEYDKEKLERVLFDFYNLTKLSVSLWDENLNQLAFQPQNMPTFCRIIKQTPYGCKACRDSDFQIILECAKTQKPETHLCHTGLSDTAVPILYENKIIGYIMFGQIKYTDSEINVAAIADLARRANISRDLLMEEYHKIPAVEHDYITSARHILNACTKYILLSKIIKVNNNTLPTQIKLYIDTHIKDKITVSGICNDLFISKNKLYSVFKNNFSCTFGDYLLQKRIKLAQNLLTNSDMPLSEICVAVGIPDYNYFIKLFKRHTGYTPLLYRRSFHLVGY